MLAPDGLALGGNWVGIPTPMLGVAPAAPCIRPLVGSAAGVLQILPQSSAFQGYTHTHTRARVRAHHCGGRTRIKRCLAPRSACRLEGMRTHRS